MFEIFPKIGNQDLSAIGGGHTISYKHKTIDEDTLKEINSEIDKEIVPDMTGRLNISDFPITGEGGFRKKDDKKSNNLNYDLKGAEFNFNTLI